MQLGPRDLLPVQEAIDDVNGQKEGFGAAFEFVVDLHEPVDEDGTHADVNVWLLGHVGRVVTGPTLLLPVVGVLVLRVLHAGERIIGVHGIDIVHVRAEGRLLVRGEGGRRGRDSNRQVLKRQHVEITSKA